MTTKKLLPVIGGSHKQGSAGHWDASLRLQVPERAYGTVTFIFTVYLLWAPHAGDGHPLSRNWLFQKSLTDPQLNNKA